jgi:hypothetical protein
LRRSGAIAAVSVLATLPYVSRLGHPSLYADDIVRIAFERNMPLGQRLIQPFNEHLAPLFELVSSLGWLAAQGRLTLAPLTYTIASFLPFLFVLIVLGLLIERETRSPFAACVGVLIAGLVPIHAEVVGWYSASSFTWALLATLMCQLCMRRKGVFFGVLAALAALAAPAFSAIGLLAGPAGAARALAGKRWTLAVFPLLGTAAFVLWTIVMNHHMVNQQEAAKSWSAAAQSFARAPVGVLILGILGCGDTSARPQLASDYLGFALFIGASLLAFRRSRTESTRAMIACGCVLVLGGYAIVLGARAGNSAANPLPIQRYQLFPVFGFVLLIAPLVAELGNRLAAANNVRRQVLIFALIGVFLLVIHSARFRRYRHFYRFPEQAATLRALVEVELMAERQGISRDALIATLPNARPVWFDHPTMSPSMLVGPLTSRATGNETSTEGFLSRLNAADRAALAATKAPSLRTSASGSSTTR